MTMDVLAPLALGVAGLGLVLFFAERLVKAVAALAAGFRVSAFLLSVVFLGFDPENLAVGVVGAYEGASGLALGTIVGAAMVAIALAFGITALAAPLRFEQVPKPVLAVPLGAVLWLSVLVLDGQLSRLDGVLLLLGYVVAILYLVWLSRRGVDIQAESGVAREAEEARHLGKVKAMGLLVLALVAIIVGSEWIVDSTRELIGRFGLSETVVGMSLLALAVSIEEVARELPAALKGRPEITYGNVNGSILSFFLFNAGVIALVHPIQVDRPTLWFYLPIAFLTVVIVSAFLLARHVPRWGGAVLVLVYAVFAVSGYFLFGSAPV